MEISIPFPQFSQAELMALLGIFAVIYGVTETVKRLMRHFVSQLKVDLWRSDAIWGISMAVSVIVSFFVWPTPVPLPPGAAATFLLPWWVVGLAAGPLSSVLYKMIGALLYKFSPDAAAAFTGNRRRNAQPLPGGIERRE
jgi:uncharacterized membrane protein HdeD (DUF308 family)